MAARSLKQLEDKFDKQHAQLLGSIEGLIAALAPGAKIPVAQPRKHLEASEAEDPHAGNMVEIDLDGSGRPQLKIARLSDADQAAEWERKKQEDLDFMEEMVTIDVHPTGVNGQKPLPFPVICNNRTIGLIPGTTATVARKFIGVLCHARPVHYENQEYEENGVKGVRYPSWRSPRFPFSIVEDSAKGRQWFKDLMASR